MFFLFLCVFFYLVVCFFICKWICTLLQHTRWFHACYNITTRGFAKSGSLVVVPCFKNSSVSPHSTMPYLLFNHKTLPFFRSNFFFFFGSVFVVYILLYIEIFSFIIRLMMRDFFRLTRYANKELVVTSNYWKLGK